MLTEICAWLRNWFPLEKVFGTFVIENGELQTQYSGGELDLVDGQYFRVIGSRLNDGVCLNGAGGLSDEVIDGAVWTMAVPPAVQKIADEIGAWMERYNSVDALGPYSSESFGGYSYTKAQAANGNEFTPGWVQTFGGRLSPWRKI